MVTLAETLERDCATEAADFLGSRLDGMELLLKEMDIQIEARMKESERKLQEIAREIDQFEWQIGNVPSSDPGIVNARRAQLFSAINNLKREYRAERIQALKDVSALRLDRQKLAVEIEARRKLFALG